MSEKCFCNTCRLETRHQVRHSQTFYSEEELEPSGPILHEEVIYSICECAGCESITVMTETVGDTTNGETYREFFPRRSSRRQPLWLHRFVIHSLFGSDPKYAFFDEIYQALDAGSFRLAVLGIRSLVEHVMIDTIKTDLGTFRQNLELFHNEGHISTPQKAALQRVVELGHAVTHRAHAPTKDQVLVALDVTEAIIQSIYVDLGQIERILKDLPPRRRSKQS